VTTRLEQLFEGLRRELGELEQDRQELQARLIDAEQQTTRWINLYVATYQLHASLDPHVVLSAISEIAANLLGAERFALLLRQEDGEHQVAIAEGLVEDPAFAGGLYAEGDPLIDATLADGRIRFAPVEGSRALCAVPLTVQGEPVGALVVMQLLAHKTTPLDDDRDLLDLLGAHAAAALFAARLYSKADRKLRALENLIRLARTG
jgi:GAF domain-containing protein